jgi:hypothetical protein
MQDARARACAGSGLLTKACSYNITIGDSDFINVRFGPVISTDRRNTF